VHSIILSGGEGSRLWPLSTPDNPKPLLKIIGDKSLIDLTIKRLKKICSSDQIYLSITQSQIPFFLNALDSFDRKNIIAEPMGRNTAPCIALASKIIDVKDPDSVIGFFPADHLVLNDDHFVQCIQHAEQLALESDGLVLLGISPLKPATGYGYHLIDKPKDSCEEIVPTFFAKKFIEKPSLEKAEELINSGKVLWNSGIYIGKTSSFLNAFKNHAPGIYESVSSSYDSDKLSITYKNIPHISIDYAITEKLTQYLVIETKIERLDVGQFTAFDQIWEKDENGNAVNGQFCGLDSNNNIVFSHNKKVTAVGVSDMIVIDTPDVLLICPKNRGQDVKKLKEVIQ